MRRPSEEKTLTEVFISHGNLPYHRHKIGLANYTLLLMSYAVRATSQVEKLNSCQYLQTAQYHASCKQGAMPVLESWYRADGWCSTGTVQPQSWDFGVMPVLNEYRLKCWHGTDFQYRASSAYPSVVLARYQADCKFPPGVPCKNSSTFALLWLQENSSQQEFSNNRENTLSVTFESRRGLTSWL